MKWLFPRNMTHQAPQSYVSVAGVKLPVGVVAIGGSAIVHGAMFATLSAFSWSLPSASQPAIQLPRGQSAVKVRFLDSSFPETRQPDNHTPSSSAQSEASKTNRFARPELPVRIGKNASIVQLDPVRNSIAPGEDASLATDHLAVGDVDPSAREHHRAGPQKLVPDTAPIRSVEATEFQLDIATPQNFPSAANPARRPAQATPGVRSGAEVLHVPTPTYPPISRRRGESGVVVLEIEVLKSGRAGTITVVSDPGYALLTNAAMEAARTATFRPAIRNGKPIAGSTRIPFRFVLN